MFMAYGPSYELGGATRVALPSQATGQVARYHVDSQSTTKTRIELPSGAKALRIFYADRDKAAGAALKVVFNIPGATESAAALAESAGTAGTTVSGVSYLLIPINTTYECAFPDPDDRLYFIDFLTVAAESGSSDVIIEVTL